jgi:hypothetical protein
VAKRPQSHRAWLPLGSHTTTYLRGLFLSRLGRTTPRVSGVVSEPSNACHRYPENSATKRDSGFPMARPGLEPGTPRFSVAAEVASNRVDIPCVDPVFGAESRSCEMSSLRTSMTAFGRRARPECPVSGTSVGQVISGRSTPCLGVARPRCLRRGSRQRRSPAAAGGWQAARTRFGTRRVPASSTRSRSVASGHHTALGALAVRCAAARRTQRAVQSRSLLLW